MREKDIEQKLVQAVSAAGGMAWKFTSPGTAGVPDRILLFPSGRMAFAELKAPGKHLRPLQKRRKIQLKHLGFTVFVIDDPEQISEVLRKMEGGTGH
ncbi:MAG: VRR-NUC domain-containing protein [Bilifractor sp.]